MKVYELISALKDCPAGAEVETSQWLSLREVVKNGVEERINGEEQYSLIRRVCEVGDAPEDGDGTVYIYTEETT